MSKQALLAAGAAALAAAAWWYRRKTAPETAEQTAASRKPTRRLCACGCVQSRVDALRPLQDGALRDAGGQSSHARAHAPVCYFDSASRPPGAVEKRQALRDVHRAADKLPADERVKSRSAAYPRWEERGKWPAYDAAGHAGVSPGVKSARAANVPADAVECMVGAANVVRATDGAAAIGLFASDAAARRTRRSSGGARRGPGALPGAEATRLVAARASAWANQATSMLAAPDPTPGGPSHS